MTMFKDQEFDKEKMSEMSEKAFRIIQSDPELWSLWNTTKDYRDRNLLTIYVVYNLGYKNGFFSNQKEKKV